MNYESLMKKCIDLAKKGLGSVSPNPLVGCVVLNKHNKIISEGYHEKYGENHAERNALINLNNNEAKGGTLIVNLEPCSHYGKTPPCADLIIEKGIKNVIIGMRDVNPIVAGNGVKKLKEAGINVVENILEDKCRKLNEVFIKNMVEHKTFIAIKTATTLDGKIATSTGSSKWITSETARVEAKNLRKKYDAILTTSSTIIADNPTMLHSTKVILDRNLRTDFRNAEIYKDGMCYVYYNENIELECIEAATNSIGDNSNIKLCPVKVIDNKIDLATLFNNLYENNIMSVFIEAGGQFCGAALPYADKVYQFVAPKVLGDNSGLSCFNFQKAINITDAIEFEFADIKKYDSDILLTYSRKD